MPQKSKYVITAKHQAYGEVNFIVPGADSKSAFETWKQIVFSPRQWAVTSNVPVAETVNVED